MDKDSALRKIKKCFELANSSEPHEAARALAQAQALMREHDIAHPEVLAAGVTESEAPSRAIKSPPLYETHLALLVGEAWGCQVLHVRRWTADRPEGVYSFIGNGPAPEVAAYSFTVLARKLQVARVAYTKAKLGRYRKNKVAAADRYCSGWVLAVAEMVLPANLTRQERLAIEMYMSQHHAQLADMKARNRELGSELGRARHLLNGWNDGAQEQLHSGLAATAPHVQLASG